MKTYAETQGEKPFDWNSFLRKGAYTRKELKDAYDLAGEWVTCACGNQCDAIPRDNGGPFDHRLWGLGIDFCTAIGDMWRAPNGAFLDEDLESAIKILRAIEGRSAEILESMGYPPEA